MSTPNGSGLQFSLRTMTGALIVAPPFILVALSLVLLPSAAGPVPWLLIGAVAALGLVVAVALPVVGYRLEPLPAGLAAAETAGRARTAFLTALLRRFALADVVVFIAIALGFVTPTGGIYVVLVGVLFGTLLAAYHVWPSERVVARSEAALEANGVDSGLREALGMAPRPPGFLG